MIQITDHLSERFASVYKNLVRLDLRQELIGGEAQKPSLEDVAYLIGIASRLALNADVDSELAGAQCQLAYDIAVRAPRFANGSSGVVTPLCEVILARIGNFPARNLLRQINSALKRVADPFLELLTNSWSIQANSLFPAAGAFSARFCCTAKLSQDFATAAKPYSKAPVHFNLLIGDKECQFRLV